jgi:hypothetical protein
MLFLIAPVAPRRSWMPFWALFVSGPAPVTVFPVTVALVAEHDVVRDGRRADLVHRPVRVLADLNAVAGSASGERLVANVFDDVVVDAGIGAAADVDAEVDAVSLVPAR